jgi:hypothetical protein
MVHNNFLKIPFEGGVRGTRKAKKGSPYEPLFSRQTDRPRERLESCYMCLVGLAVFGCCGQTCR